MKWSNSLRYHHRCRHTSMLAPTEKSHKINKTTGTHWEVSQNQQGPLGGVHTEYKEIQQGPPTPPMYGLGSATETWVTLHLTTGADFIMHTMHTTFRREQELLLSPNTSHMLSGYIISTQQLEYPSKLTSRRKLHYIYHTLLAWGQHWLRSLSVH